MTWYPDFRSNQPVFLEPEIRLNSVRHEMKTMFKVTIGKNYQCADKRTIRAWRTVHIPFAPFPGLDIKFNNAIILHIEAEARIEYITDTGEFSVQNLDQEVKGQSADVAANLNKYGYEMEIV